MVIFISLFRFSGLCMQIKQISRGIEDILISPVQSPRSEVVIKTPLFGNFQVPQHRRPGIQGKAVTLHPSERHKVEGHLPTVQIAVYAEIGEGKGPGHDVIVGVHIEPPVFCHVQTSPQIDRLGEPPLFVGVKPGIIEGVVKPEIPGDIEIHIIAEVSGEFLLILNGIPGLLRLLFTLLGVELQAEGEVGIGQSSQFGQSLIVIPGIPVDPYPVLIGHVRVDRGAEVDSHPLHGGPSPDADGLQVHGVGDQVIRGGQTQIVDQLHLFEGIGSCGILHILHLHLQIIVERKGDIPGGTPPGITVDTPVKNGIVVHSTCGIGLHLLPETEFGISEIGIVTETDRRRELVPDPLNP